jgi:hypothetical protein
MGEGIGTLWMELSLLKVIEKWGVIFSTSLIVGERTSLALPATRIFL